MQSQTQLGLKGSLLLFDRWHPSKKFIAHTINAGFFFVMRAREKWNLDVGRIKTQGNVVLRHDGQEFSVRVLKVLLPSGETETLLTNLEPQKLPICDAADLYFKRWGIETAYDPLKSKLQLENFSGRTEISVFQDFYATVYLAGLAAACAKEADVLIADRDQLLEQLCQDIAARPESVRPGRSPLHKSPRNKRFPMAKKAVLP